MQVLYNISSLIIVIIIIKYLLLLTNIYTEQIPQL